MTFIQDGEAHSASQSTLQTIQSLLEMSVLLLAKLQDYNTRLREQQRQEQSAEQSKQADTDPLSPQEKELTNGMAAIACVDVLNQYGQSSRTEFGEQMRVYQAEGFVVAANAQDETGYLVYHLYNHEGGEQHEVLSFQQDPKDPNAFIFFETEAELTVEQRISLVEAFQHTAQEQLSNEGKEEGQLEEGQLEGKLEGQLEGELEGNTKEDRKGREQPAGLSGIARVQQRFEQLGECAPEGTKALLVAHYLIENGDAVLKEQGKDAHTSSEGWSVRRRTDGSVVVTGDTYQFHKSKDGTVSVAYANTPDASKEHLYQMKPDGSVHQQAGVEWDRSAFQQMHSKLTIQQNQAQPARTQSNRSSQKPALSVGEGR